MVNTLCVVIPFLNEKPELIKCLQSIARINAHLTEHLDSTCLSTPIEWIFVDGGSTDGSRELLAKLGHTCICAPKGRAVQMNAGAKAANSEWLIFLHVDTLLDDDFFHAFKQVKPHSQWGYFTLKLACKQPIYRFIERSIRWRAKVWRFITGDQTLFIRREYFFKQGGFADIALMEDVELTRKLYKDAAPVILEATVITSARKWQCKGAIKTVLFMWWIQLMYRFKVSPSTLHRWYYNTKKTLPSDHQSFTCSRKGPRQTRVAQLAKAPLENYVKTRLAPVLSPDQRLNLHKLMIKQVLIDTQPDSVCSFDQPLLAMRSHQLWVSHPHAYFEQLAREYNTRLYLQKGRNLGDRLAYCLEINLPIVENVVLVGSDCVSFSKVLLNDVCQQLEHHDAVIVPATDGGFVLLGLTRWHSRLFDDIDWGTEKVFKQLCVNLEQAAFHYYCFDALNDIDRPEDLSSLPDAMRARIA